MNKVLFADWTIRRILYLVVGLWAAIQSALGREWLLMLIGVYFIIMAVMKIGCAGGQCDINNQTKKR